MEAQEAISVMIVTLIATNRNGQMFAYALVDIMMMEAAGHVSSANINAKPAIIIKHAQNVMPTKKELCQEQPVFVRLAITTMEKINNVRHVIIHVPLVQIQLPA